MLKAEILDQAQALGISLSENMFQRYFEYGLIVSVVPGHGYVRTQYHGRTMEAIEMIDKLKSSRMYKHQKDYIFILYWKGYPVQGDKLKARLIEFHTRIMTTFKEVAGYTAHPEYPEIIEDIANDEAARAPKAIGRPTKQSEEMQRIEAKESATRLMIVSKLIANIIDNGTISLDVFRAFNQLSNIDSDVMNETILEPTNDWLQMKTWKNAVRHSDEQDYQEAYELITLLKEYWSDLEVHFGSVYDIPFFGSSIKSLEDCFQLKFFSDKPSFYRYVLLVLISGGFRQQLMQFLSDPATREKLESNYRSSPCSSCSNYRRGGDTQWVTSESH